MNRVEQYEFSDIIEGMPAVESDPVALEIQTIETASETYGPLVTGSDAARFLGISAQGVADLLKRGKLTKVPGLHPARIPLSEVRARRAGEKEKVGRPRKVA